MVVRSPISNFMAWSKTHQGRKLIRFTSVSVVSTAVSALVISLVYGFKIIKGEVDADRVATQVITLSATQRREEIARMLAGAEITKEARAAAKSLIEKAG